MQLIPITVLVLLAFASNSIINRMAVGPGLIDPMTFALIRAIAGALTLVVLCGLQARRIRLLTPARAFGASSLTLYLIGFSVAYLSIDAGLGALVLFAGVQITMFVGGLIQGERPSPRRWIGAAFALAGLAWLCLPRGGWEISLPHVAAMLAAAFGWGIYSLLGARSEDPLADTAANFVGAVPMLLVVLPFLPLGLDFASATALGIALAILGGAVTSGIGYAMWYSVLPQLGASRAALLQLLVPVIAAVGGLLFLAEPVTLRMLGAGLLTLGGIAYGLGAFHRTVGSKGS